jgi:transcriptional regulator with XRE-family HTH domain
MSPVTPVLPVLFRPALKDAIFRRHISQARVAKRIGMSDARLSLIIHGKANPNAHEKRALARLLDTAVEDLFPGEEND